MVTNKVVKEAKIRQERELGKWVGILGACENDGGSSLTRRARIEGKIAGLEFGLKTIKQITYEQQECYDACEDYGS